MTDKLRRLKRALKSRANIARLKKTRLSVHRSGRHIEAQLIDTKGKVLAYLSTKGKAFKSGNITQGSNVEAATQLGKMLAEEAVKQGIKEVAFDRSGFQYHGRVKALADAAREGGLIF